VGALSMKEDAYCTIGQREVVSFYDHFKGTKMTLHQQRSLFMTSLDPNNNCNWLQTMLVKHFKCIQGWTLVSILGQGEFGIVFMLKRKNKINGEQQEEFCAAKLQWETQKAFISPEREIDIQKVMAKRHLAPSIVCQEKQTLIWGKDEDKQERIAHLFLMSTVDMPLSTFLAQIYSQHKDDDEKRKSMIKGVYVALRDLLLSLRYYHFTHGDLHTNNIMFKKIDGGRRWKLLLIDFGQSSEATNDAKLDISQLLRTMMFSEGKELQCVPFFKRQFNQLLKKIWMMPTRQRVTGTDSEFTRLHRAYRPWIGKEPIQVKRNKSKSKSKCSIKSKK
jgi:serine/threonine protein kinase